MSTLSPADNLRITTDFTLRLCALLRRDGVDVSSQQSIACLRALTLLGSFDEEALKEVYRLTLVNRRQDLYPLQVAYEHLLRDYHLPRTVAQQSDPPQEDVDPRADAVVVKRREFSDDESTAQDDEEMARTEGYSTREVDYLKDFRLVPREEVPAVMAELAKVASRHATMTRRKTRRARRHGEIDLRASVRDSVRYDGEIIQWRHRRKVPTHSRWVIVSDVSGSMEIYSIFLLNFIFLLHSHHRMKLESFVFSTRLEHLVTSFKLRDFQAMLKSVAAHFSGWSGGTKIGAALETLNDRYGTMITPKTNVVIISDGWDTGDLPLLDREMARLKSRARSITWINPLKANPAYEPLAQGMATAFPYCDRFITGHSVDSLAKFASLMNL